MREIKEDTCYVALDPVREQQLADDTTIVDKEYKLPDGKTIRIGYERFKAAEVLFRPESAGWTMKGIA